MGWWETGQGDDVIGDGPADTITETLRTIATDFEQQGRPKPTVRELLDAIVVALRSKSEEYFAEGNSISIRRLIARLEPGSVQISSEEDSRADEKLVAALGDAFEDIVVEYEDSEMERKPRLNELLKSIQFVLSYRPEDYLSETQDLSIKEIEAELE